MDALWIGAFVCAVALLGVMPATVDAESLARRAVHGRVLLEQNCARCHAIDRTGDSPMTTAPPMRDVYTRFLPRELEAELEEGMLSYSKDMPQIMFSSEDADAILAWLYLLAARKNERGTATTR